MRDHLTDAQWRTSIFSGSGNACVEVADLPGSTAVRDSKNPDGCALVFSAGQWRAFTSGVRAGQFD